MPNLPMVSEPYDFEDVTSTAELIGIKYPVFLDSRIDDLFAREVERIDVEEPSLEHPVVTQVLYGLRFLLNRFRSTTRFRYSIGPGLREPEAHSILLLATFYEDNQRGLFVVVTLDIMENALIS